MLAEFFDITGAIQKGVVGVQVQVDELGHGPYLVYRNRNQAQPVNCCAFPAAKAIIARFQLATWGVRPMNSTFREVCGAAFTIAALCSFLSLSAPKSVAQSREGALNGHRIIIPESSIPQIGRHHT